MADKDHPAAPSHKRRLSRKEQKARKRQKKRQQATEAVKEQYEPVPPQQQDTTDHKKPAPYIPTPLPSAATPSQSAKSLGRWFPTASVYKCPRQYTNAEARTTSAKASLVLFYQYVEPPWPESKVEELSRYLADIAAHRGIGGRIRIAREGVNATVSAVDDQCWAADTLGHFARDLQQLDAIFQETHFKYIDHLSADRHFAQLKVFPVQELVYYGLDAEQAPLEKSGVHLPPKDFHERLAQPDTVVVDVRNHYEAAIGRFDGQQQQAATTAAAQYINPKMRKSTDFTAWLEQASTQKQLEDKQVLLYCTGGIRCIRASAILNQKLGPQVKGVYQLQGGIEAYLQEYRDGGFWRGKNFTFDKREAVSADHPDGDGGVVSQARPTSAETSCIVCQQPWDRYIGKQKCTMCGVPVLVCVDCLSTGQHKRQPLRCPLCEEQDVTVPAAEVEYTDNGTKVKAEGKAAPSVCKWGGGHATKKHERRRLEQKECKFGSDCRRADCFFAHPAEWKLNKSSRS